MCSGWGYICTVDIGLDNSVEELLTRVSGVLGSIPGPAIYFQCTSIHIYNAHSSFPITHALIQRHILKGWYFCFKPVLTCNNLKHMRPAY